MKNFGIFFAPAWQCEANSMILGRNHFAREGNKMLRRLLILILLVIILVSLNWFKVVMAQDLSSLSEDEKQKLKEKYKSEIKAAKEDSLTNFYESPEIFEDSQEVDTDLILDDSKEIVMPVRYKILTDSAGLKTTTGLTEFENLKPFGMELFNNIQLIEPAPELASAADYILGPGDNVIVYLWGKVDKELNLTIDREGKVFIQRVGEIVAWGLTLGQFTEKIKASLSQAYSDFRITVSLGKIRSIRIYVSGEVKNPGAFTVSSLTSVINALYLANGPNERGSMRNIKVMRSGKVKEVVDLYDLLLKGDNASNIKLESNDVIFVPVANNRAAIRGEVKREAIYELKRNETTRDLLNLAGGATPTAYLDRILLERVIERKNWVVMDLNLNELNGKPIDDKILQDGDRITVNGIYSLKKNTVGIFGKVEHQGFFERNDSTRISDIIKQAKLQPYDVYLERADVFRRYTDWTMEVIAVNLNEIFSGNMNHDIVLKDQDSIIIHAIDETTWDKWVFIEGAIKTPGRYKLYNNMTAQDLIFLAGSYNREASLHQAEIARMDSIGEISLIYVPLESDYASRVILNEGDHLYVRQIPEWQESPVVVINGEVKYPGEYMLSSREETLYHLLKRCGGFTQNAFPTGLVLERESIGNNLERISIRSLIDKSQPLFTDSLGQAVKQNLFEYDPSSLKRIIIDIDKLLTSQGKMGDVVLEPGDMIYVPSIPSGVTVMGAVGANGTIKFNAGTKVSDYIKRAGNFTKRSDKKETKLIRANGEIISGKKSLGQKVELGDIIFVPSKIEKERYFWKTFTEILSATTSLLTTVYIVSKL